MEINKKQVGTVFIAAIFVVSGISLAFTWQPPSQTTEESSNVIKQPIADQQRTIFIESDVTILTLFYLEDDGDSLEVKKEVEKLNNQIGEKLLLEEIDIRTYQTFSASYNVKSIPVVLLRGKENTDTPIRLEGIQDYLTLKEKICITYNERPQICV